MLIKLPIADTVGARSLRIPPAVGPIAAPTLYATATLPKKCAREVSSVRSVTRVFAANIPCYIIPGTRDKYSIRRELAVAVST